MTKETYLKIKEDLKAQIKKDIWLPGYRFAAYWCIKHRVDLFEICRSLDPYKDSIEKWIEAVPSIKLHVSEREYKPSTIDSMIRVYKEWLYKYEASEGFTSKDTTQIIKEDKPKGLFSKLKEKILK